MSFYSLAIVLSDLHRFTTFDYPLGIFNLFFRHKINKINSSSKKHTVEKNGCPRLANVILVSMKLNLDSKSNLWYPKFLIIDSLLIVNLEDTIHGVFGDKCFEMWLIRGIIFVFVNLKAEKTWFVFLVQGVSTFVKWLHLLFVLKLFFFYVLESL